MTVKVELEQVKIEGKLYWQERESFSGHDLTWIVAPVQLAQEATETK